MKTLTSLIREIFSARRNSAGERTPASNLGEAEYNNHNQTQTNETETFQTGRVPELDNSSARETDGEPQESQEHETGNRQRADLAKAFQEGVVAGRNQKIEETYYPKADDGIPAFHGMANKATPSGDIFSLAREA